MPERIPVEAYEKAAELLEYNPDTGLFRWKTQSGRGRVKKGWFNGCPCAQGYYRIRVGIYTLRCNIMAWFFSNGYVPERVDHENRIRGDNRLSNLRACTQQQNIFNGSVRSTNTSGVPGVGWHKQRGKWRSYIKLDGKDIHLGCFTEFEEAVEVRKQAEIELFGDFAPKRGETTCG